MTEGEAGGCQDPEQEIQLADALGVGGKKGITKMALWLSDSEAGGRCQFTERDRQT